MLQYVNRKSNHPPSVLKQIPKGVGKRLLYISSSEEIFKKAVPEYQDALRKSGYEEVLKYEKSHDDVNNAKKRRRSIIWYNPPYSANVRTNVGRIFRDLINTHFHHQHKYHKIFNKNTVKLSYSCMRNVAATIRSHNAALLRKDVDEPHHACAVVTLV